MHGNKICTIVYVDICIVYLVFNRLANVDGRHGILTAANIDHSGSVYLHFHSCNAVQFPYGLMWQWQYIQVNNTAAYTRITDNLKFLKSKESLAVLDQTLDFVTKNNLSFIDGFQYFTEAQVEKKKANLVTHSVLMAGFPKAKTLSEFEFEYQPSINKQQIYDLNSLRFLEKKENIVFYGNSGVGKTHLATAIGITAAQNRYSTYFIKCSDLMESLHKAQFEGRFSERLKKYCGYKLLIIDELGYLPISKDDSKLFFQLIDKRYERNCTVITTNINFAQWDEIFGDPLIANAIIDRLLHHATIVTIKGKSYRLQNIFREMESDS